MTDPISIVITVIITVLVILLTVIGIEIFRTLKQLQKTMTKADTILDDLNLVSKSVSSPIVKISNLIQGLQEGSSAINLVSKIIEKLVDNKKNVNQDK